MAYRLYDPNPVYFNLLGTAAAGNGTLRTYADEATTTPFVTYSDPDLSIANPTTIPLDSDGRANVEIWSDEPYFLKLFEEDGTLVWTREITSGVAPGAAIPDMTGHAGEFLSNDGTQAAWTALQQLPDPTDSGGYMVVATGDGGGYTLQAVPEPPEPPEASDIVIGSTAVTFGDGTSKLMIQTGTDTAPTSGSRTTSKNITFPTSFTSLLFAGATANVSSVGTYGIGATGSVSGYTAGAASTGVTVTFNSADDGGGSGYTITNTVPFNWVAIGLVAADE